MAILDGQGRPLLLTARQEKFCREYVVDLNATAAAARAGYHGKGAARQGCILLQKPHVKAAIERMKTKQFARVEIKADNVLLELSRIAFVDPLELFTDRGALRPIHEIPEDVRRAIASIEVETLYAGTGVSRIEVGNVVKVKFWPKSHALDTLGKHFKLWVDRLEISGTVELADRLKAARERLSRGLPAPAAPKPTGGTKA